MRILALLSFLLLTSCFEPVFSQPNTNGWLDTASLGALTGTNTKYSAVFDLLKNQDIIVTCEAMDRGAAGFANDSIQFEWGYSVFHKCLDSANNTSLDTCFGPGPQGRVVLDTMVVDSFGKGQNGITQSNGNYTSYWKKADTTNVTGYAVQSRWFLPESYPYIRFWAHGLAKNRTVAGVTVRFNMWRRIYTPTRAQ